MTETTDEVLEILPLRRARLPRSEYDTFSKKCAHGVFMGRDGQCSLCNSKFKGKKNEKSNLSAATIESLA